jgi:hypothetical protein
MRGEMRNDMRDDMREDMRDEMGMFRPLASCDVPPTERRSARCYSQSDGLAGG